MRVYIIAAGMGRGLNLTNEANKAIEDADVLIGAGRMLEMVDCDKESYEEYKAENILNYLKEHTEYKTAAILLSGDISFYSGAKKLREVLSEYELVFVSGVSSYAYLCGKLGIEINETAFVSLHGADTDYYNKKSFCNIVRDNKYTFILLNEVKDVNSISAQLSSYKLENCILHIASRLGYEDESIITTPITYMFDVENEELSTPVCIMIENPTPQNLIGKHLTDDELIRNEKVPMTKDEIRALCISKLKLKDDSVMYDVGAGTGSISVEAALTSHNIRVFAIEKKSEVYVLVNENRCKFGCDNIMLINGEAPTALEYLPNPTHVFIGGSGGRLEKIVKAVLEKNPNVRIVINTVALNSTAEVMNVIKKLDLESDIISVNIAKSKKLAGYDMMTGQNQVYIFTLTAKVKDEE